MPYWNLIKSDELNNEIPPKNPIVNRLDLHNDGAHDDSWSPNLTAW